MNSKKPKTGNNQAASIILGLLITSLIAALMIESSGPSLPLLGKVQGLDKVAHFLAFSGLGLLFCALSFKINPRPAIPFASMPLLMVTLFGIIEECYQTLIPGRTADPLDLLTDICGALFAIIVANCAASLIRVSNRISAKLK